MSLPLKRLGTSLLALALVLVLPGCWDYESISTKSPLIGIGIDAVTDHPERLLITVQYPLIGAQSGQSGGPGSASGSGYKNLSEEGYTLKGTLSQIQLKMNHEIDVSQLQTIVLSQTLSPEMMHSVIGQLIRLPKMNRLAYVLSTQGSAKDILAAQGADVSPLESLQKTFQVRQHGFTVRQSLWEYWRDSTQLGVVPFLPTVQISSSESDSGGSEDSDTGDSSESSSGGRSEGGGSSRSSSASGGELALGGIEVYSKSKSTFYLNRNEVLWFNLLVGQVRDMSLDVPVKNGILALDDLKARSRLRVLGTGDNLTFVDNVKVHGLLAKAPDQTTKPIPETDLNQIQAEASKYLVDQLTQTMKELQQQQADIMGYGRIYLQQHPEDEEELRQQWGEMFQNAKFMIRVNVTIVNKGMLI